MSNVEQAIKHGHEQNYFTSHMQMRTKLTTEKSLAWTGLLQLDVHLCSQTSQTFDILGTGTKAGPLLIGQFPAVNTPQCWRLFFKCFCGSKTKHCFLAKKHI